MKGLLGKKIGMTQYYDDSGNVIPVTVVEAGPCRVLTVRTKERDGYSALQLGYGNKNPKNMNKAVRTHVSVAGCKDSVPSQIGEIRLAEDSDKNVGDVVTAEIFKAGEYVDVIGVTKGRGFQGVVKRYNFAGGRESHGGDWSRRGGSIGMCVNPGRVYPGRKMPGHTGNVRRAMQNLKITKVIVDDNILLIKGSIPGANGGYIVIREAKKIKSA